MIHIDVSPIAALPSTVIHRQGPVCEAFLDRGASTVHQAAEFVNRLPYGNNRSSENAMILFADGFGTCLTKHGIVARLAEELGIPIHRSEGFYRLTDEIVTGVGEILAEYGLPFIPRTHCFLSSENIYVDLTDGNCTGKNGLIETYLEISRLNPEQTQAESDDMYRRYYAKICAVDLIFARVGIEGLFEVLHRCQALNALACHCQSV